MRRSRNRSRAVIGIVAAGLITAWPGAARAQQTPSDSLRQQVEALLRRVEELELKLAEQEALLAAQAEQAMRAEEAQGQAAYAYAGAESDQRLRRTSGIYSRPFVARFGQGTAVGGYVDLEFEAEPEEGEVSFEQKRFIPFLFAEITDRVHFGAEIEFEEGGEEVGVEFAAMDVALKDWLNVRGGLVLSPLGKFNLIHDSPVNDLTARPLVDQRVIPTTLSEAGIGLFGTLYPSDLSVLTYEAYLVNGFDQGIVFDDDGTLRLRPDLPSGRVGAEEDNNANKAVVARIAYSPILGLEVGGSIHTGVYAPGDDAVRDALGLVGDERLTILALDGIFSRGPFELLGEFARASMDVPAALPEVQQGYYVQGNYHFGRGLVSMFPNSIFTAVVRWDDIDLGTERDGDVSRRLTFGLNWRPVEQTVFKFDAAGDWEFDAGETEIEPKLFFSLATYF
ncbi:MAG TPA: hypothetical protein VF188_09815 [Longimicrobiales bacterium]